jgi:ABC-type antimicrobial peptide transport system permease subunit
VSGLIVSLLVTRVLASLLSGVGTLDPVTFLSAPGLLIAAAVLAVYLPTRRATRVDPVVALRND